MEKKHAAAPGLLFLKRVIIPLLMGFFWMLLRRWVPVGGLFSFLYAVLMPASFLYAVRRAKTGRQAALCGFVFALGFFLMNIGYTFYVWLDFIAFFLSGLCAFPAFLLDRRYAGKRRRFLSTLIFPACWVLLFNIMTSVRLGIQYRLDAYATLFPALNQTLSLVGSVGTLFLLTWLSSFLVYIAEKPRHFFRAGTVVTAGMLAGLTAFGGIRLKTEEPAERTVRVAMATIPYLGDFVESEYLSYEEYVELAERYAAEAAAGGAELLMFTEEALTVNSEEEEADSEAVLSSLASRYNLHILVAEEAWDTPETTDGRGLNRIRWIDSSGKELFRYAKYSLVPVIETMAYIPGEKELPSAEVEFRCGKVKIAAGICYDSNFSVRIKQIPSDTELLFLPSWDWSAVAGYHREVARELAVENGVTVVKNTYDGESVVIDPLGKTVLSFNPNETGYDRVTFADVPVQGRQTVYSVVRIYGVQASVFLSLAAIMILEIRKRKTKRSVKA